MISAHSAAICFGGILGCAIALAALLKPMPIEEDKHISFSELTGWHDDRVSEAYNTFYRSCERIVERGPNLREGQRHKSVSRALFSICEEALRQGTAPNDNTARAFFEDHFDPVVIKTEKGRLLTGYYEPELRGSRRRYGAYQHPLYAKPSDLIHIGVENRPADFPMSVSGGRKTDSGIIPYYTRLEIDEGVLSDQGLELVFIDDPVAVFFAHVQGSVRVRLDTGEIVRFGFAAKSGHPYTAIGKPMREDGRFGDQQVTATLIKEWLRAHPEQGLKYMQLNKSYIFFQENEALSPNLGPIGGQGLPLTPGRSLAIDLTRYPYGVPIWISARLPLHQLRELEDFNRLMVAQDTGSAIVGAARADIFFGSGDEAGTVAGRIQHEPNQFVVFMPKGAVK